MADGNGSNGYWRAPAFTRLRGNVKGVFDEAVGPKTLFVGANQSGKSGRIIGVRYALFGVAGWSLGVHGSAIAELAPEGDDFFFAELDGPSGHARFEVKKDNGKWKDPEKHPDFDKDLKTNLSTEDRKNILPMVTMSELLDFGADRGRRAFMLRFGNADKVPQPVSLKPEQQALWDKTQKEVTSLLTKKDPETREDIVPDASVILVAMNKAFNAKKIEEGKKITGLEKGLDQRRQTLATQAAGSELIPALRTQLAQAQSWESAAHLRARKEHLEKDKVSYRENSKPYTFTADEWARKNSDSESQRKVFLDRIALLEQHAAEFRADLELQAGKLAWGQNLVKAIEGAKGCCPLCNTVKVVFADGSNTTFDKDKTLAVIRPAVADREASIKKVTEQHAAAMLEVERAKGELGAFDRKRAQENEGLKQAIQRLSQEHGRILAQEKEVDAALLAQNAPVAYNGPTAQALKQQIDALENADIARKKLEEDTAELRRLKDVRDDAKELESESKKLLDELVAKSKTTGEAAVNRYMPHGARASIDLDTNTWCVSDKSGRPRSKHAACGFELDALVPALAAAYTEGSPLRVLALDDPDVSGIGLENVERFFGALGHAIDQGWLTQIFVAGNRFEPVIDKLRAMGWTIIRTDSAPAVVSAVPSIPPPPPSPVAPAFGDLFTPDGAPRL
jgi:hypothetical protein